MPQPQILHRDDFIVAIDKPSGWVVHRGWANDRVTVMSWARKAVGTEARPVHRLDRATSGVLLLALHAETAHALCAQFDEGAVLKNYLALTRGITPEQGLIDHGIRKSKLHERRPAETAIRRLGTYQRYSLVEARPFTGRQHQVRRHLEHIAHPIIGDTRYGKGEHNRKFREMGLARLCLHASRLSFVHPATGERMGLCAALPQDLAEPFAGLGLGEIARAATQGAVWAPPRDELVVLCSDDETLTPAAKARN